MDLLGEIIKQNQLNIFLLNKICVKEKYLEKFFEVIGIDLINSNLLIRVLFLAR